MDFHFETRKNIRTDIYGQQCSNKIIKKPKLNNNDNNNINNKNVISLKSK